MTVDVEVLSEVWTTTKEYIPSKDRQAAADHVVAVIADGEISETDLKQFGGTDQYIGRAVYEYLGEEEDPDEDIDGSDDY
jgi:hypothetical protein